MLNGIGKVRPRSPVPGDCLWFLLPLTSCLEASWFLRPFRAEQMLIEISQGL